MTFKAKQEVTITLFNRKVSGHITRVNGSRITVLDVHGVEHTASESKVSAKRATTSPLSKQPKSAAPKVTYLDGDAMRVIAPQPKNNPLRSAKYLAYVRSKPCAVCGATQGVEASHHGKHGTGTKPDDHLCIPLCKTCHHDDWHKHGTLMGWNREETESFIVQTQRDLLIPWFIELHGRPNVNAAIVEALITLERGRVERIAKP